VSSLFFINPEGKVCIGLACSSSGMSPHAQKSIEQAGGLGSGDMSEILDLIAP
jgi:hypothetical protein